MTPNLDCQPFPAAKSSDESFRRIWANMQISEHSEWLTFKQKGVLNHNKRRVDALYSCELSLTIRKALAHMSRIEQLNKEKVLLKICGLYFLVTLRDLPSTLRIDPQCTSYFNRNCNENYFREWLLFGIFMCYDLHMSSWAMGHYKWHKDLLEIFINNLLLPAADGFM